MGSELRNEGAEDWRLEKFLGLRLVALGFELNMFKNSGGL